MDNVTILTEARGVINRGWIKHERNDGHGNHCALGAIDKVIFTSPLTYFLSNDSHPVIEYLVSALDNEPRKGVGRYCLADNMIYGTISSASIVADYNNHPDTTKED